MTDDRDVVRISFQISGYHHQLLKLWSKLHGRPVGTHVAAVVTQTLETNFRTIRDQIKLKAEMSGEDPDKLMAEWLDNDE